MDYQPPNQDQQPGQRPYPPPSPGVVPNQQAYQTPPPFPVSRPEPKPGKGLAITGMVFGISSAALCEIALIPIAANVMGWLPIVLGIVGLILSVMARKQGQRGMATAGLICSIIGIAISCIGFICYVGMCAAAGSMELFVYQLDRAIR